MTRFWFAASVLVPITAATTAAAQQPRSLGAPTEFPAEFSSIRGLRALPDGRLVVTDQKEQRIHLLDFAKGTSKPLARSGQGPSEYQAVGTVQRDKGGGVAVYDPQQKRFLPIAANGSVQDVRAVPNAPRAMTLVMGDGPDMYTMDTVGHIYTTAGGTPSSPQATRSIIRDGTKGPTTLAELRLPESRRFEGGQGISMTRAVSFSPRDYWAVGADGWVAVVRASPYRIDWYPPTGQVVRGPTLTYEPLPVTEQDKKVVRDETARMMSSGRPTATINGKSIRPPAVEPDFADTKPPVTGRVALIDEQGRLWVERSQPAGAATSLLDVIDRTGAVVHRVTLPAGSRLVGFDRTSAYAARTDEDDLVHLQHFPLP